MRRYPFVVACICLFCLIVVGCCPPNGNTKLTVKIKSSSWETERGADYTNITDEHDRKLRFRGTHDLQPGKTYEIELSGEKKVKNIAEANFNPQLQGQKSFIKIEPSDKNTPRTFRVTVDANGKVTSEEIPEEQVKLLKDGK